MIEILRRKADELNIQNKTDFWTPGKVDMALWSYGANPKNIKEIQLLLLELSKLYGKFPRYILEIMALYSAIQYTNTYFLKKNILKMKTEIYGSVIP